MHCAGCANAVDKHLEAIDGVHSVQVNLPMENAVIEHEPDLGPGDFEQAVTNAGYTMIREDRDQTEDPDEREERKLRTARKNMTLSWIGTAVMLTWMLPVWIADYMPGGAVLMHSAMLLISSLIIFYPGIATMKSAWKSAFNGSPNMDVLIALGALSALATGVVALLHSLGLAPSFHSFAMIAGMIMAFHLTGRYIETRAKGKASEAIRKLLTMGAKEATVLRNGEQVSIPVSELTTGDIMVVKPGERIPTDGEVTQGESEVDESLATGESVPVLKQPGDEVIGSTINTTGSLRVKATRTGDDTFLSQIIRMVEEAQATRVPIQDLADRITKVFVPVILILASLTLMAWLMYPGFFSDILMSAEPYLPWVDPDMGVAGLAFYATIAVLVIACPCALGLATPTALMVGSGLGARNGILIRNGAAIQRMKDVDTMVLDKTGTITEGRPAVTDLFTSGKLTEDELLALAATAEQDSEHPLAKAVMAAASERNIRPGELTGFESITGKGVRAVSAEKTLFFGNKALMEEAGTDIPEAMEKKADAWRAEARTVIYLAADGNIQGILALEDRIREGSMAAIEDLKAAGIEPVMITGDNRQTAESVAAKTGISRVYAGVLPEGKADIIMELQQDGKVVAMAGDGINDAPALSLADVGLAMGTGTDIAIESGDIVLVKGDLNAVLKAIRLSKATFRKIRQNLFWAFFYNVIMIPLALFGMLHPLLAESAMAFSSVNVVLNSRSLDKTDL